MTEREEFEKIKEACLSEGGRLLIADLKRSLSADDTIKIMPVLDSTTGQVVISLTDKMLIQKGYVDALEWMIGIMSHYQENEFQGEDDIHVSM